MTERVHISGVEEKVLEWVEEEVERERFASISHAFRIAINELKDSRSKDKTF